MCVCVLYMCVWVWKGHHLKVSALNQTSERDDKSALWFGPQRLTVGSKNQQPSAAQAAAGQVQPPPFPAEASSPRTQPTGRWDRALGLALRSESRAAGRGEAAWSRPPASGLFRYSGGHCLIKAQAPGYLVQTTLGCLVTFSIKVGG